MRGQSVLPIVFGILTITVTSTLSHEEDAVKDSITTLLSEAREAEKGCNYMKAKSCFLKMTNASIMTVGAEDHREKYCKEVKEHYQCLEDSMENCTMAVDAWRGLKVLAPYVQLMKSIASTACMADSKSNDMEKEGYKMDKEGDMMEKKDDCNLDLAGSCLMGFFYVAAEAQTLSTCWQASQTANCIAAAMAKCSNKHLKNVENMVTSQLKLTAETTCVKPGCNPELATECLLTAKMYTDHTHLLSMYKSPILCGTYWSMRDCVMTHTQGCSKEVYESMSKGIYHLHLGVKATCSDSMGYQEIPDNAVLQNLINFKAITNSPFVSPEVLCPYFDVGKQQLLMAPMDEFSLETIMKTKMVANGIVGRYCDAYKKPEDECVEMPLVCNKTNAKWCVKVADMSYLIENMDILGQETVCTEAHKLAMCVNSQISGCRMEELPDETFEFWHLLGTVASFCPIPSMLASASVCNKRECDVTSALTHCFPTVKDDDIKSGKACMRAEFTLQCVKNYTEGCVMSMNMLPAIYVLHSYIAQLRPYCTLPMMANMNDGMTDHSILKSSAQLLDAMYHILTKSYDFNKDMCHMMHFVDDTAQKQKKVNPMIAYDLTKIHQMGKKVYMYKCTDYKEEELKNMTTVNETEVAAEPACGKDLAAHCVNIHYFRLSTRHLMPISEKNKVCYGYEYMKKCVEENTANCSEKRKEVFKQAWHLIDVYQMTVCPRDSYSVYMSMHMGSCAPETAKYCADWMAKELSMASPYNHDHTCMNFGTVMNCIEYHTKNCSADKLEEVKTAVMPVIKLAAPKCLRKMNVSYCNATSAVVNMLTSTAEAKCYFDDAMDCINFYNSAKSLWNGDSETLCLAAKKAKLCAMYHVHHCSAENITAVNNSIQAMIQSLGNTCQNMTHMNSSNVCGVLESMPVCSTNYDNCFPESPAHICGNASAIKACLALHVRGCMPETVVSLSQSMQHVSTMFATVVNSTCDLVPKLPSSLAGMNFTSNATCTSGADVFNEYLLSDRAHMSGLCRAFSRVSDCLTKDLDHVSVFLKTAIQRITSAIKKMTYVRCQLYENLDMLYDKEMANTSVPLNNTCYVQSASLCMSDYISISLYAGLDTLHDRKHRCESRYKLLECIHETTKMCPRWVRTRIEHVLDFVNSVNSHVGACSMMEPRVCEPHYAMKCIASLGEAFSKYGHSSTNSAVCAGLVPTEMCVMHHTSSCEDSVRLNVEHTFADVASGVMKICKVEDMAFKKPEAIGMCDKKKAKKCMMSVFSDGWDLMQKGGDRSNVCRTMSHMAECVSQSLSGCHEKEALDSHMPVMKSLMTAVCMTGGDKFMKKGDEKNQKCMAVAGECMHNFLTISMEGSVTGICSQIQPTMKCMMSVMKECHGAHSSLLKEAAQQVAMVGERLCMPTKCDVALAMSCVKEADMIIKVAADRMVLEGDDNMCSGLKQALICIGNHTSHCRATDHPVLMKHISAYRVIVRKFCPAVKYNVVLMSHPEYASIFSVMAMAFNPMVTKEDICPQAIDIAEYVEHMKLYMSPPQVIELEEALDIPRKIIGEFCDEDKKDMKNMTVKDPPECDGRKANMAAIKCMEENRIAFRIAASPYFGWQPVCQSLHELTCCLSKHLPEGMCNMTVINMTMYAMHDVHSVVHKHCPVEDSYKYAMKHCPMPREKSCRMKEAVKCLPEITDSNRGEICSKWVDIMTCAEKNLEGCHSLTVTPFNFMMERYYSWINCQTFAVQNTQIMIDDSLTSISACFRKYAEEMHKELQTTTHFVSSACRAHYSLYKCLSTVKKTPISMQYIFAAASEVIDKDFADYCKKEKAGTCPPVDKGNVGICLQNCSMDSECTGQHKCCSNGCGHVCTMPQGVTQVTVQKEPATCLTDVAATCVTSYMVQLANFRSLPLHERKGLCSHIFDTGSCTWKSIADCSDQRQGVFLEAEDALLMMHAEACPSVIKPLYERNDVCAKPLAQMCIDDFAKEVYRSPMDDHNHLCKKAFHALKCVHTTTKNCSTEGLSIVLSLEPVMSILGNSCPLASAIRCSSGEWKEFIEMSTCNKTVVEHLFSYLDELASKKPTNMTAVCRTFEYVTMVATMNTMRCDPEELGGIHHTWELMMATFGKKCIETGLASADFVKKITDYNTCEQVPECSTALSQCLPMTMNPEEICSNTTVVQNCIKEKLAGCDKDTAAGALGSVLNIMQQLNVSCSVLPTLTYTDQNNVVRNIEPWMDQCQIHIEKASMHYLLSKEYDDDDPICEMFHNFTMCVHSYTVNATGFWKGIFTHLISNVAAYTKTRCKINAALGEAMDHTDKDSRNSTATTDTKYTYTWKEMDKCDQKSATMCVKHFMTSALYGGLVPLKDRKQLCMDRLYMYNCITNSTVYCSSMLRMKYLKMQEWISRLAVADGICPHVTEEGKVVKQEEMECELDNAMECLHDFSSAIVHHNMEHQSVICSKVQPVAVCVVQKTWGCSKQQRKAMEKTYKDLATVAYGICYANNARTYHTGAMSQCPGSMHDGKRKCNVAEAMYCVSSVRSVIMEMKEQSHICGALMRMKECVMQHVSGCKSCQLEGLHGVIKMIKSKVNCPELECDVCGAAMCVRDLSMRAKNRSSSCLDVWKTKQCVETKMKHCSRNNYTMMVAREMESVMKSATLNCEYPKATITECAHGLATLTQKILGLGHKVKSMFEMDDDKDEDDTTKDNTTTTARPDDMTTQPPPTTKAATTDRPTTTTNRSTTDTNDKDEKDMDDKFGLIKNLLKHLMGMKVEESKCDKEEMNYDDMDDMATMCHYAGMKWHCVKSQLHQVEDENSKAAIAALLPIVHEAVTSKCLDVLDKRPLICYACRGAKSNQECNHQLLQTCDGDRQMCMTMIEEGVITKGCARRIPLLSSSDCVSGGKKCFHACDRSYCNWPANETIREGKTCNSRAAMVCAMSLTHDLLRSSAPDCRKIKAAMKCVYKHTEHCLTHREVVMHKRAYQFLHSPVMLKCAMEDLNCRCGSCSAVSLGKKMQSRYLTQEEKCEYASKTRKNIMEAMIMEDCSVEDLDRLNRDAYLIKSVIGTSCPSDIMIPANSNADESYLSPLCDLEGAHTCVEASHLESLYDIGLHKHSKEYFCTIAKKMMLCVYWYTAKCDVSDLNRRLNSTMSKKMMAMHQTCGFDKMGQDFHSVISKVTEKASEGMKDVVAQLLGHHGDRSLLMAKVMYTMYYGEQHKYCKPTTAYHSCFHFMENTTPDKFCESANRTHDCLAMLTHDCLWVQKAPLIYLFRTWVSADLRKCGFEFNGTEITGLSEKEKKSPDYQLAQCSVKFVMALKEAYLKPNSNFSESICYSTYMFDRCIHQPSFSPVGKTYMQAVTLFAEHLMETTCGTLVHKPKNCSREDQLCNHWKSLEYMFKDNTEWWKTVETSDECKPEFAATAIDTYILRLLGAAFSSLEEYENVRWEGAELINSVNKYVDKCSEPRKEAFQFAATFMVSLTKEDNETMVDKSESNCSMAEYCLNHMNIYAVSPEAVKNRMHVCWALDKVLECVEHHAFNCTATEMTKIQQGLHLTGNLTKMYCPSRSAKICKLSMMEAPNPAVSCNMDKIRQCVTSYYDATYDKKLSKSVYCPVLQTAKTCLEKDLVNCQPYIHKNIAELMVPGMYQYYSYNCSAQQMVNYEKVCPVMDKPCNHSQAAQTLFAMADEITRQLSSGTSKDNVCRNMESTYIAQLKTQTEICDVTSVAFLNYEIDFITRATGLSCTLNTLKGVKDEYDMGSIATCIQTMGRNMEEATLQPKYGFYDFCNPVKTFNNCMVEALTKESSPVNILIGHLLKPNQKMLTTFYDQHCKNIDETKLMKLDTIPDEAPPCDVHTAFGCVSYFSIRAVIAPILPGEIYSLCKEPGYIRQCVHNMTKSCSSSVIKQQFRSMLYFHESMVMGSGMCEKHDVMEWHKNIKQMVTGGELLDDYSGAMEVVKSQMGVMQKAIVDAVKAMSSMNKNDSKDDDKDDDHDDDSMNKDDAKDEHDGKEKCRPREAMECVLRSADEFDTEKIIRNKTRVCRAMERAGYCMVPHLYGCDSKIGHEIGNTLLELHKLYMIICQMPDKDKKDQYMATKAMADWLDTTSSRYSATTTTKNVVEDMRHALSESEKSKEHNSWNEEDVFDMMAKDVEKSDTMCVSVKKYTQHGRCNMDVAMKTYSALFNVTMDPYSTHEQICLTHAIAVRVLLMTGYSCDRYAVQDIMHQLYVLVDNRVGEKCPTVVKESCEEEDRCNVTGILECYAGVKHQVEAALHGSMEAYDRVCDDLGMAAMCAEKRSEHCEERIVYQVHDAMQPGLETLSQLCTHLPPKVCTASAMWKMAAITLVNKEMFTVGYYMNAMMHEGEKDMDEKANTNKTTDDKKDEDKDDLKPEQLYYAVKMLHTMMGGRVNCMQDKKKNEDMVTGLMHLIRYAYMYNNLIPKSKPFMNVMTVAMVKEIRSSLGSKVGGEVGDDLGAMLRYLVSKFHEDTNKNATKDKDETRANDTTSDDSKDMSDVDLEDLVGKILTQLFVAGDGSKFISHVTHKGASAKMRWAMEMMKQSEANMDKEDDGNEDDDNKEKEDEKKDMDKGMSDIESQMKMVMETVVSMYKYERANMTKNQTMGMLHVAMELLRVRKTSVCVGLLEAWHCSQETLKMIPEATRDTVNATLNGLFEVAKYFCHTQKCYSCHGFHDNQKCNEQGMKTCDEGQMCYTYTDNNMVYKGCTYMSEYKEEDPKKHFDVCFGEKCNQYKYGVVKEVESCNPMLAIHCMSEILPIMLQGSRADQRMMMKAQMCMEAATSHCVMHEHRDLSNMAHKIKKAMFKQCSAPESEYQCGLRSVYGLAALVGDLNSPREAICTTLNDTMNLVKMGAQYNYCTEHELMRAYNGLRLIYSIIGADRCPGVTPSAPHVCQDDYAKNMKPMCAIDELPHCLGPLEELKYYIELVGDIDTWSGVDYLCKLVSNALTCVRSMTTTCSDDQKPQIYKFVEEHLSRFIPHCPAINFVADVCHADDEMEDNCRVSEAIVRCLDPEGIKQNPTILCSMNSTMVNHTYECLHKYTAQCTAAQSLPISYTIQNYATTAILLCGNHSLTDAARSGKFPPELIAAKEMLMFGVMSYSNDFGESDNMPITKMGSMLMLMQHHNGAIGNLAKHVMMVMKGKEKGSNENLSYMLHASVKMSQVVAGKHAAKIWHTDATHGIARCVAEYLTYIQRALMYPKTLKVVMCEALTNAESCMQNLDICHVTEIFVSPMVQNIGKAKEEMCKDYLEHVAWIGHTIANKTMEVKSMMNRTDTKLTPEQTKLWNLLKKMMSNATMNMSMDSISNADIKTLLNGLMGEFMETISMEDAQCNRWKITTSLISSMLRVYILGFNRFSEYQGICHDLLTLSDRLSAEIKKCSPETQEVYNSVLEPLKHTFYHEVCHIGTAPATECHDYMAYSCLQNLMPYVSSAGVPRETLCSHVAMTQICVSLSTRKCNASQLAGVDYIKNIVMATVGNSCPYISAAVHCEKLDKNPATPVCNVTLAKQRCVAMVTDEKDEDEKCGKLPAMVKCFHDLTTGCGGIDVHDTYMFIRVALMPVIKKCSESDKMAIFNRDQSCAAAKRTCSLKAAVSCALSGITETDCNKLTTQKTCVENAIKDCSVQQRLILLSPLMLMEEKARNCYDLTSGLDAYRQGVALAWGTCTFNFLAELTKATSTPVNAQTNICNVFSAFEKCMKGNMTTEESNFMFSLMGASLNATAEIINSICHTHSKMLKGMVDGELTEEPFAGCNIPDAAACMSSFVLPAMLSSSMTQEDKESFCDMKNGVAKDLVNCIYLNTMACPKNSTAVLPVSMVGTAVHSAMHVSGVCAKEAWVCSVRDALSCGVEASEKAITNTTAYDWEEQMCNYWDEYHMCVRRNTWGCSKEVQAMVKDGLETGFCIGYDMYVKCPSFKKMMSMNHALLPKCPHPAELKHSPTCDVDEILGCLGDFKFKAMEPGVDCSTLHGAFADAMKCLSFHEKECNKGQLLVTTALLRDLVGKFYEKCPQAVHKPCIEDKSCRLDEAQHCLNVFEHMVNIPNFGSAYKCLTKEMAHLCVEEKLRNCSMFGEGYIVENFRQLVNDKVFYCKQNLEVCIHKFIQNSVGIIYGDVMMAEMSRLKGQVSYHVTQHFMEQPEKLLWEDIEKKVASTIGMMTNKSSSEMYDMNSMLPKELQSNDSSYEMFSEGVAYMWNLMVGGSDEDYDVVHAKAKALQCAAVEEAYQCLHDKMLKSQWGYLPQSHAEYAAQSLGFLYYVTKDICPKQMTCTFINEPVTCKVGPAMYAAVMQMTTILTTNTTKFCENLPIAIEFIKNSTETCTDEVKPKFDRLLKIQEMARDTTICHIKEPCQKENAEKCLSDFKDALSQDDRCSKYEVARDCLDKAKVGCSAADIGSWMERLKSMYSQISASCRNIPDFTISDSSNRLVVSEGQTLSMSFSLKEAPGCGSDCEIRVRVSTTHDKDTPKCNDKAYSQLKVKQTGSASSCGMVFTDQNWNKNQTITLTPTVDGMNDKNQVVDVLVTASQYQGGSMKLTRNVADFQVSVLDEKTSWCTVTARAGITSFDNLYHRNILQGLYVVYKHATQPLEVFAFNQAQGGSIVTCAAIVKLGDDAFYINRCRMKGRAAVSLTMVLYMVDDLAKGTHIYEKNDDVTVILQTGTRVNVKPSKTGLLISVASSATDKGQTKGLCGLYNGDKYDDAILKSGRKLQIENGEFASQALDQSWMTNTVQLEKYVPPSTTYCSCGSSEDCGQGIVETCTLVKGIGSDATSKFVGNSVKIGGNSRRKRQTGLLDITDNIAQDSSYVPEETQWKDWTYEKAAQYCKDLFLNNAKIQECKSLSESNDYTAQENECIDIIKEDNSVDNTSTAIDSALAVCALDAAQSGTTDAQAVLNKLCPNDCTSVSNGDCKDGQCLCYQGWLGADCSIKESDPPKVSQLANYGRCPLTSNNNCKSITLIGEAFTLASLQCHFQTLEVNKTAAMPTGVEKTSAGTYISSSEVLCTVPDSMATSSLYWGVRVRVSNGGQRASAWSNLIAYNSVCYECSSIACPMTTTSCLIDGNCYDSHVYNPNDECEFCVPVSSQTSWTRKISGTKCPVPTQPTVSTEPTTTLTTTTTTPQETTKTTTTQKPIVQDEKALNERSTIAVVAIGCVCGIFIIITCVLAVKLCQKKPDSMKGSRNGSSPGTSIQGNPREFDNLAYDNFEKKPMGGLSTFQPSATVGASEAYSQNVVDMGAMETDDATRL